MAAAGSRFALSRGQGLVQLDGAGCRVTVPSRIHLSWFVRNWCEISRAWEQSFRGRVESIRDVFKVVRILPTMAP